MSVHSSASESVSGAGCESFLSFGAGERCLGERADATLSTSSLNLPLKGSLPCWYGKSSAPVSFLAPRVSGRVCLAAASCCLRSLNLSYAVMGFLPVGRPNLDLGRAPPDGCEGGAGEGG